ncbi:TrkA family potassium uptake protein [Parasegetibacter sp. NRK P23]|uniref:potassium channel family protein n=1 Tax=Parasegetibacter sp. NRK P23 TaxID=2942999 RepID=UPI002044C289|nr:TrkA family potassium uptake protein [Parasegetibacter sp. NRK P23]MCM5528163.1 TrkA family potassium uptake protein [Parasegetibacter sp. NRK P23]
MKFVVFGLGNFGASLSQKLVGLGHEVIGTDVKPELADKLKNRITHTITLDATNRSAMQVLPLADVEAAIVAIGENEGVNIMATALLKELKVKRIICRVTSPLQKTVLEAMNINEFTYPEEDSAERLAYKLDVKGAIDSFKVSDEYQLLEAEIPVRFFDRKVSEIEWTEKYKVQLVTIIRNVEEKNIFGLKGRKPKVLGVLSSDTTMREGDILVLFGAIGDLERFLES